MTMKQLRWGHYHIMVIISYLRKQQNIMAIITKIRTQVWEYQCMRIPHLRYWDKNFKSAAATAAAAAAVVCDFGFV